MSATVQIQHPFATPARVRRNRVQSRIQPKLIDLENDPNLDRILTFATPSRSQRAKSRIIPLSTIPEISPPHETRSQKKDRIAAQSTPINRKLVFGAEKQELIHSPEDTNEGMLDRYQVEKPFASGRFSQVSRVYPKFNLFEVAGPSSGVAVKKEQKIKRSKSTVSLSSAFKGLVLKSTPIKAPKDVKETGLREIRILHHLSQLSTTNMCHNFVHIQDWYKTRQNITGEPIPDGAYVHGILEFADIGTLKQHQVCSWDSWRSIAFQCLYALFIAQRELQFVHLDLHADNILLTSKPQGVTGLQYVLPDGSEYFLSQDVVKISDFGLSRIRIPQTQEILAHPGRSGAGSFEPTIDLESLGQILKALKIEPPLLPGTKEASMKRKLMVRIAHVLPELNAAHVEKLIRLEVFDSFKLKDNLGIYLINNSM